MPDLIGHTLGQYQILREIGRGGMAVVYQARDLANQRDVALKVLHPHLTHESALLSRFMREGRSAARLHHPNIVQIYDAAEVDGYYYIALELIEDGTLAERMTRVRGPMKLNDVVDLISQMASGLNYAHKLGFVHRDIKPGNVLLTRDGRALVSDFGIAKLSAPDATKITQTGLTVGTPAFMSPEQARGEANIDRRSDIYSLGVTAYAMLTGTLPFQGDSPLSVLRKVIEDPLPSPQSFNPAVPPGMAYALMRVLIVWIGANVLHLQDRPSPTPLAPTPSTSTASSVLATDTPLAPTPTPTSTPTGIPTLAFRAATLPIVSPEPMATVIFDWQHVAAIHGTFEHPEIFWPSVEDRSSWWRVADGVYRLTVRSSHTMVWMWRGINVRDFAVAFDGRTMVNHPNVHFGLIFRGSNASNFYQLDFAPGLGYELLCESKDKDTVLVKRSPVSQVRVTGPVRLGITAVGAQIQVSINEQPVALVTDETHSRGDLALYGVAGDKADAEFAFDNYDFEPEASEAIPVKLLPYVDPAGQFTLYVPDSWTSSIDEHGVNFDSVDHFVRVFVHRVPAVQPADTPAEVARKYINTARQTFQNIVEEEGRSRRLGKIEAYEQTLSASVLGTEVKVRLIAVNSGGQGYVVVSAVAASLEPALRPLLNYMLDSFHLIE